MPTRMLRDGILTSEPVCSLTWAEEVFYRRLMSVADDHGRFYALPKLLRSACYPLQIDKVSDSDIGKWLTSLVEAALVRVYPAEDGKRYVEIQKFGQRVQSKSKFPDPSGYSCDPPEPTVENGEQPEPTALVGGVVEVGCEGVKPRTPTKARKAKRSLPDDFGISDRVTAWAAEKGYSRLADHLESFRSKARAKGYEYIDWDDAFMNAIREDWAKLRSSPQSTVTNGGQSPAASRPL